MNSKGLLEGQDTRASAERMSPLDAFFAPEVVAVIGATEKKGKVGHTLMVNLLRNTFRGRVYPVNAQRDEMFGLRAYRNILAVPEKVDLAVICTPAATVPDVIAECAAAGVAAA